MKRLLRLAVLASGSLIWLAATGSPSRAADVPADGAQAEPSPPPPAGAAQPSGRVTEIPRSVDDSRSQRPVPVRFAALLIEDGPPIETGLVWRVYREAPGGAAANLKLVNTNEDASPVIKLEPGPYLVVAALGRAHIERKILVKGGESKTETFVLNAGGFRLTATVSGQQSPANAVTYNIYADEGDQFETRTLVMSGAKPGIVMRLNSGIYEISSHYGDANAIVKANVTVEAGKLTEVAVAHTGARISFRLVAQPGGEALPDAQWTVLGAKGETVKTSVGALPSHILAPGSYKVSVLSGGKTFVRDFAVTDGVPGEVEVVVK